jgi:GNAT superfamily N-acetyltransferase
MTEDDIPLGMRLKAQAGWNQTEADWRRFLWLQSDGCFVAELDGAAVGTTACFVFGPVAWVAMVLVDEAARGRGVGTALTRHALAFLDDRGVKSVRLDATPLGRPIYEKLGFVVEYTLLRYQGALPQAGATIPAVEPGPTVALFGSADLFGAMWLDDKVTQAARCDMVARMFEEVPHLLRVVRGAAPPLDCRGYLASRPGANAVQIGPCLATDEEAGRSLLADAAGRYAGQRVFIDVPLPNTAAVRVVEALGLRPQRELVRMVRGAPVAERADWLWASSGPEKG